MNPQLTQRISLATALSAALLALLALALWGPEAGIAAILAGALAAANWGAIHWVCRRVAEGRFRRNGLMVALAFKSGLLMLVCWLAIRRFGVDFNGFTLGMGALVLGVLAGPALTPPVAEIAEES